jgi:hypothetical protein
MKSNNILFLIAIMSMAFVNAYAYDIIVGNSEGVSIYYNYINDGTELEVTRGSSYYEAPYSGVVVIPEEVTFMNRTRKVTKIGKDAFWGCTNLSAITIPNSVTCIAQQAFGRCKKLSSITIPSSVKSIEREAFSECEGLNKIIIKDIAAWCNIDFGDNTLQIYAGHIYSDENTEITNLVIPEGITAIKRFAFANMSSLTSVIIPNSVTEIGAYAFLCSGLISVALPNSVTSIEEETFSGCYNLTSIAIPNSVTLIANKAFWGCQKLESVTIPSSVKTIGYSVFCSSDMHTVISEIEQPFAIKGKSDNLRTFTTNTFNNATLYVPVGTKNKYMSTDGWKDFLYIEEGSGNNPSGKDRCEKPTISYNNGKLVFKCATEGVSFQSTITDSDIKSYSISEVQLGVTYEISVFATKDGYENSETVTATLCWVDVEPKTEGIDNGIAQVRANAVMIKADGGKITVEGADDNTVITVYSLDGIQVGSTSSRNGVAYINTNLSCDSIAILKIGDRSFKVIMK